VVIADDHRLFVEALEAILGGDARVEVVGTAADGRAAVDSVKQHAPDVVLLDISMPVMDGLEAAEELRDAAPETAVLMLTGSNAPQDVDRARRAGAHGYVTKDSIAARLVDAIVGAATGNGYR
jgi:DNA-binding NarL/FixJ family response regulator